MASALKTDEIESFREVLKNLRARLRGDVDQLTDDNNCMFNLELNLLYF